jgi:ATP-binding cassette subfamily F protein 3
LRTILGSFLFKGDDVFKQVLVLSGGEKSRLALAQMLLKSSNFLVLDEPTNHLDMNSKQVLMKALQEYTGTMLIISHDREFLDGIVDKIIEVKNGNIKIYPGNCSYYLIKKKEEGLSSESNNLSIEAKPKKIKEQKRLEAESRNKLYNLLRPVKEKITEIEGSIKTKEERIKEIENEMASETFYRNENHIIETTNEFKMLKDELEELYNEWFITNNKLNEISINQ